MRGEGLKVVYLEGEVSQVWAHNDRAGPVVFADFDKFITLRRFIPLMEEVIPF